jgi:RNA polymerase sigma-70 factor, ECF subfamily
VTARYPSFRLRAKAEPDSLIIPERGSSPNDCSDETLLAKICSGDREALAMLFRRHAAHVRNVGRQILRDRVEADDLVQEVFLYLHRKSALFDSTKGSACSWIIQVAYTQALLKRRELKSQGFYASSIADKLQESEVSGNSEAKYDLSVEGLFGRTAWRKVLDALTPDQRETLRLHFFEGYTFSEIADKVGQSYVSVRHHYYRGLDKLRKHLTMSELSRR